MIRKHIIFYGYVQGVGFRWRARQAANHYSCTGWVHNEWDGSVSMEIQGGEENIDLVIMSIQAGRYIEITKMEVKTIPLKEHESGFITR
jgi:acylphosphatase